jgi:GNAT superfamily N-acetyltransferase
MGDVTPDPQRQQAKLSTPVPLTPDHDVYDWLKHRALKNESRFSRTYVVCDGKRVVAYFCVAAGAVERTAAPGKIRRNAPDTIPVSVIGRLAVSRNYAGRGLGADILSDALRRIAFASQSIGIGAVLVHAKDDQAKRFYTACAEFIEYPADSRILFLPIETVIAAFS